MSNFCGTYTVRTRKPHKCWGCGGVFPKGQDMLVATGMFEDQFFRSYYCPVCEKTLDAVLKEDCYAGEDGWGLGDLRYNYPILWGLFYEKSLLVVAS